MIRVSTIIPVFNGSVTLAAAIDSALSQRFQGQEVIVVNDGSTDATSMIIASYGSKIRAIDQSRRGASAARNAGARIAGGEYFAFLDADDLWLEGRLAKSCAALDVNANAVLAFSDLIPMNDGGQLDEPWVIGRPPSLGDLQTRGCGIYPSAVTMRRSVYEACGGFDERLPRLADHYFWMLARELGEFAYVAEPLAIYRTTDFTLLADKYLAGFSPFVRAVRRRYGKRTRPLVRYFRAVFASSLVARAASQFSEGARLPAFLSLGRAVIISPSYFFICACRPD
ncbi:MAG: glycosyltransferase [Deltaproteobacteria bacterium]|nr:glycosyltransferase [Deltaproteobacteria bacterium]